MKDEKETKKQLLVCAKAEFLAKGYSNASLRNICKDAGVTTGALYFFFRNKEELFTAIVEECIQTIMTIMKQHYQEEQIQLQQKYHLEEEFSDDFQSAMDTVHYMYQHREELLLILTKAQGSKYEHIVDEIVALTEQHYKILAKQLTESMGREPFDDYFIHWMSHMQIDVFVHLITHEEDEKNAEHYMRETVAYLEFGWKGLLMRSI